jgi:hypothetical protein
MVKTTASRNEVDRHGTAEVEKETKSADARKRVHTAESAAFGANIDAVAYPASAGRKRTVEADDAAEREDPDESVDPARGNKIVEDAHVAEATMRAEGL